jgi:hypothetical protein
MPSQEGARLSQLVRQKIDELSKLCGGIDEETASRAPADRWTPKQILSHLCGPEGVGLIPAVQAFLNQDTPRLDMEPANNFYTGGRIRMTVGELLAEVRKQFFGIADIATGLSDEQLGRKAQIPMFKDAPFGEYPTLAIFIQALAEHHLAFHIEHMREVLQALGTSPE